MFLCFHICLCLFLLFVCKLALTATDVAATFMIATGGDYSSLNAAAETVTFAAEETTKTVILSCFVFGD